MKMVFSKLEELGVRNGSNDFGQISEVVREKMVVLLATP